MATCTDIDAALARLEAKIDAISKVDEQAIIQKSIAGAENLLNPQIVVAGTTASLALTQAGAAQKTADAVKSVADDALRIGGQALSKAGKIAGGLANLFGKFSGLLGTVLNLVATVAAFAILASRIDGLEAEVNALREVAGAAINKANLAQKSANEAIAQSNEATTKANAAISQSNDAISKANLAIGTSQDATVKANQALSTANSTAGELPAMKAETRRLNNELNRFKAETIENVRALHADLLKRLSIMFEYLSNYLNQLSDEMINNFTNLGYDVYQLEKRVSGTERTSVAALNKADQASGTANNALAEVKGLRPSISNATSKASEALKTANNASVEVKSLHPPIANATSTANNATNTANNALGQIPPLKLLSEKAYSDALKAYNKVNTDVPPVVNGIEQVRRANQSIRDQFKNVSQGIQQQFRDVNTSIQEQLKNPSQTLSNQNQAILEQFKTAAPTLNNRITTLERINVNSPNTDDLLKDIQSKLAVLPKTAAPTIEQIKSAVGQAQAPSVEDIKKALNPALLTLPAAVGAIVLPRLLNPTQVTEAAKTAVCQETAPNGCLGKPLNNLQNGQNRQNNLLQGLNAGLQTGQGILLTAMNNTLNGVSRGVNAVNATATAINIKMGAQMVGGLSGAFGRLSNFLGIDRIFNLINFMANLHNAFMLSNSLKLTLLEMLSSIGNATGLLQSAEGENVDLNAVYNKGIRDLLNSVLGEEQAARLEIQFRRANRIYQAAANATNAISSMMNSLANVVQTGAEYGGKIGNALKAAGAVSEQAYQWMAEKFDAQVSPFMKYSQTVGDVTTALETINEIAQSVVEGQQAATEFQKANTEFAKAVAEAKKNPGIENKAVAAQVAKQKENATKDPTGEDETGLLSFLTDL